MAVPTTLAEWLKSTALYVSTSNATLAASLLTSGLDSEIVSPLAASADATNELARQMSVLGGPLAIDRHVIKGARRDLICKPVQIFGDRLGYAAGPTVFVVDVDEQEDNTTALLVVRRLS